MHVLKISGGATVLGVKKSVVFWERDLEELLWLMVSGGQRENPGSWEAFLTPPVLG